MNNIYYRIDIQLDTNAAIDAKWRTSLILSDLRHFVVCPAGNTNKIEIVAPGAYKWP